MRNTAGRWTLRVGWGEGGPLRKRQRGSSLETLWGGVSCEDPGAGVELGFSVTREERGRAPGRGTRAVRRGRVGRARVKGRTWLLLCGWSGRGSRAEGGSAWLCVSPPEPQQHARLGHDGPPRSRVPGRAAGRPLQARGLLARGPSARPRVRGISHVRPLPSLAGVRAS